jgi:pSer/pThr/pTyr-binding forkhead associated (FHA) protein
MVFVLDGRALGADLDPPLKPKLPSPSEFGAYAVSFPQLALRFISGKYQGGEFPIRMEREIVIGRSSELDMVLVEDMVSRKHAKIDAHDGQITIQDLGSTNGTFVNGEKIKKCRLKEGDRILIGTSIIKMVGVEGAQVSEPEARQRLEQAGQRRYTTGSGKPMSGVIEEIPLPDLLQLLSTSRKSGVLSIHGDVGVGRIYLRKGQIYFATINEAFDVPPRKALYRLLSWQTGTFELEPPDEKAVLEEITESTAAVLIEGMRQLDEVKRLEDELPPRQAVMALAHPLQPSLRELQPADLDVLQLALNHGTIQAVLDRSPHTDLDTLGALKILIAKKYVLVQGA